MNMISKKTIILAVTAAMTLGTAVYGGIFDDFNDYQNPDGTYSYYFMQGVTVTMNEEWYQQTFVKTGDYGATFYHKDSYDAYLKEGFEGGRLFTIGASVNSDFRNLPSFDYLGFDEEECMNYFVEYPTDVQGYYGDDAIMAEYQSLYADVEEIVAGIQIDHVETDVETEVFQESEVDVEAEAVQEEAEEDPDQNWDTSGSTEITEELKGLFDKAFEKLMGVEYEPIALLGTEEKEGTVYCFLCRATGVYPDAKPYNVLAYIHEGPDGSAEVQNIWEIWLDWHSEKAN